VQWETYAMPTVGEVNGMMEEMMKRMMEEMMGKG
jgi:hypothetical protein